MTTPLLENILHQPEALKQVAEYHFGQGRAAIEQAAALLRSRKKVVLSGMGASYFACIPFQYMLAAAGLQSTCIESAELLYFQPGLLDEDTVLVLVSRSGESVEVTKLLAFETTPVLGIMNVADSTLHRRATHAVLLNSPADQLVAIQTYISTVAVFALISAALSGELEQAEHDLERTIQVLRASIPEWVNSREAWHSFLETNAPVYLLGRGSSLGAVAEGVLLMHETAKSPAVGMSVPQFRHGPVEVVDEHFRGIVMGTQRETLELDLALANDLVGMKSQVRWLGGVAEGLQASPLCSWPQETPARFSGILEIIPLQILAYTKAEIRGVRPGDFRWAPAITSTETGFCLTH